MSLINLTKVFIIYMTSLNRGQIKKELQLLHFACFGA